VRLGAYTLAVSNIFGTNLLEVALLLPADLAYRSGPILSAADDSVVLLGSLGILTTCIYLWGLLERRGRTFLGMGIDSCLVLLVYLAGSSCCT
jgi:cation:H+ antiporter